MNPKPTVLVLGHDVPLAATIADRLGAQDAQVCVAPTTAESAGLTNSLLPDVVVATDSLSDADLLRAGRRLRDQLATQHVALLVLAAPDAESGRPAGTDAKQRPDEVTGDLLAVQIRNWLDCVAEIRDRRDRVTLNGLEIDRRRFLAKLYDRELSLTPTEFRLLWTLARSLGQVLTRAELSEACRTHQLPAHPRTIDVHIKSIRHKLAPRGDMIETVRGIGYRLRPPSASSTDQRPPTRPQSTNQQANHPRQATQEAGSPTTKTTAG